MGSKVIGFRVPDDLAEELDRACAERGQTTGEVLRRLVDDMLYPGSGRDRLEERRKVEAREDFSGVISRLDNLEQQLKEFDDRLELVQVDRGLTEADKEHYDGGLSALERELTNLKNGALAGIESELAKLKVGVNRLVHTVNNNVEIYNEHFVKVARLFQFLEAHSHNDAGKFEIQGMAQRLLEAEVALADKRAGELPVTVRKGKVEKPGWKYLEHTERSVKKY